MLVSVLLDVVSAKVPNQTLERLHSRSGQSGDIEMEPAAGNAPTPPQKNTPSGHCFSASSPRVRRTLLDDILSRLLFWVTSFHFWNTAFAFQGITQEESISVMFAKS